jgi:excisionase family DNA binding protein
MTKLAYTVQQVAEMLGISYDATRRLINTGKLRARNTGKRYIIPQSAIDEYLAGSDDPIQHPESLRRSA